MHVFESSRVIFACIRHKWRVSRILPPCQHPPWKLDLNRKVTVMCEEEKQTAFVWGRFCSPRRTLFPAPPLSPKCVVMLSSLFCREINVEEAPHPREGRAPQLRRKTHYCRTMWTDTLTNKHINTIGDFTLLHTSFQHIKWGETLVLSAQVNGQWCIKKLSDLMGINVFELPNYNSSLIY